ncbi:hypothetical protein EV363DRAFT_1150246 [Boletus edulis]|uniref:Uncharacterized protein n=1 Tax=Boletus edulis BED1 TaxID=1328754 RepID=A0AAD4BKM1_BOLED|nr:hypothetical protein EV363DRAFT_1150246 [Boletus edulis]KAF8433266.1 hypothetical protein L210DRAFT_684587 [Boletus edulis BED1]
MRFSSSFISFAICLSLAAAAAIGHMAPHDDAVAVEGMNRQTLCGTVTNDEDPDVRQPHHA